LDRQEDLDHLATPLSAAPIAAGLGGTFQDVVARLRAPDGCPWDREQTHESLRTSLLEEAYEVLAALDADDMDDLRGELGDLLLQIIFHAQIAVEDGDFRLVDTVAETVEKLIRRHPHVFADDQVADADDVLRHWEQIKRAERAARGESEFTSMLAGINKALPALSRPARCSVAWPGWALTGAALRTWPPRCARRWGSTWPPTALRSAPPNLVICSLAW
jgi:tetrapyrrole methylase family protein/MazG family protein